ncbi:MAG: YhfC family intramembrane metalloprotease [Bacteroidales bacterium]|nr:YhfC family intramembrane metalloprotease [Bacteroidales bacterium]
MIPVSTLISMALAALLGIAVPVVLAWWLVRKYHIRWQTILIGAATFIVFALVLEPILHKVVLQGPYGVQMMANVWYYALYGGLAAGLFEETGRFLSMKFLMKREPSTALPGVGYGTGHGGIEMLIIFGISMISNLTVAAMINSGQADVLTAKVPEEQLAQVQAQFAALQGLNAGTIAIGFWERISALVLQLGLSMMVWTAVRRGGKWLWLFPAAILLHALVDALAVILSKSVDMVAVEVVICALAVAVGATGFMLGRKLNAQAE